MRLILIAVLLVISNSAAGFAQVVDYVGSDACTDCHQAEARVWAGSHHARAWTEATSDNILADFMGTEFTLDDMTARFRVGADGRHYTEVTERDGQTTEYPIHSVVGIEPLQQYLIETAPGRLQSFDVVWDTEANRWFHLYPDQNVAPSDGLHWTGPYKNWNGRCAVCHSTGYEAGYDPATDTYQSSQIEIGVGCEACHGPGADHIAWAVQAPVSEAPALYGFSADLSTPEGLIQQCAGCHSRREQFLDHSPVPGTSYHDSYNLALLRPGLYYPDGKIRDEVYVYGSFLQSKMYEKGVTCANCHNAHTAELIAEGNAVCTQCHSPAGNPDFPSLRLAEFDSPAHHHHPKGSTGADCKSCHMTEQVYMGNDWRADHSFHIPRPDLAAETGTPDACTSCHTDQSADWAAAQLQDWFPDSTNRGPHFGQVFARAEINSTQALGDLVALARNEDAAGLVRATAIWLIDQARDTAAIDEITDLVDDPDPMIRAAVVEAIRNLPPQQRLQKAAPALGDPARNVRIAAAQGLYDVPAADMSEKTATSLRNAVEEWQSAVRARLDFPETHMQLGGFALIARNLPAADQAFERAVALDPKLVDAWMIRIRIAAILGQEEKMLSLMDAAQASNPGDLGLDSLIAELTGGSIDLLPPAE